MTNPGYKKCHLSPVDDVHTAAPHGNGNDAITIISSRHCRHFLAVHELAWPPASGRAKKGRPKPRASRLIGSPVLEVQTWGVHRESGQEELSFRPLPELYWTL
jgi:hypothetical protein